VESRRLFELVLRGRKITLGRRTIVMGVLNVTPDSFSDGGLYLDCRAAGARGLEMARQGADWIDVGGESTRPGAKPVPAEEELRRVLPVIRELHRRAPSLPISIDTAKAAVADAAVRAGASIINDVSGLRFDPAVADVAHRERTPLVLMHLRGRPETMQQRPFARAIARSLGAGLAWSIRHAVARGVPRSQLVIDPGLGFGKTRRQNFEILATLRRLRRFRLPLMVGSSRKSFVQAVAAGERLDPQRAAQRRVVAHRRVAQTSRFPRSAAFGYGVSTAAARRRRARRSAAERATEPWKLLTTGRAESMEAPLALQIADAAAVVAAILGGAHIVRVHDVAAMLPAVRIADAILAAGSVRIA
jgi:dihydropteroate synthase